MTWTETILSTMLSRSLAGGDGHAYPQENRWDAPPAGTPFDLQQGEKIRLSDKDAKPLIRKRLLLKIDSGTAHFELTEKGIRFAIPFVNYKPMKLDKLLDWAMERALFHPVQPNGQVAIPLLYTEGTGRLVLVLGENGAGKSVFRRIIHAGTSTSNQRKAPHPVREFISFSMEGRTDHGSMFRSFIYGNETWHSTGDNSGIVISKTIKTAAARAHTTVVYWDEPDIGMSGGASAGAGIAIRDFVADLPPLVQAVFLTSHSPVLLRQLAHLEPHYIYLGDPAGPLNLKAWFAEQENPKPISPARLQELSAERFKLIQPLLKEK